MVHKEVLSIDLVSVGIEVCYLGEPTRAAMKPALSLADLRRKLLVLMMSRQTSQPHIHLHIAVCMPGHQ